MLRDENAGRGKGIDLSVKAKDGRYPIPVYLDGAETPAFTLKFNPGDPFILDYADKLQKINAPEGNDGSADAFIAFTDEIERNVDAIFGDGAARVIFRHDGPGQQLLAAVIAKVREGYEDFNERSEAAEKAAKAQAVIDARKEGSAYAAPPA